MSNNKLNNKTSRQEESSTAQEGGGGGGGVKRKVILEPRIPAFCMSVVRDFSQIMSSAKGTDKRVGCVSQMLTIADKDVGRPSKSEFLCAVRFL